MSKKGQRIISFAKKHRYRLALFLFLIIFSFAALYNLGYMSVQWDEMPHLNGGLLLTRGQTYQYMTTYGYYPPLFDIITTGYFQIFGISQTAGRLVSVTFALLAIWLIFEFTKRSYGNRNAMIASITFGVLPGIFWLSRITLLETILIFFFILVMFSFYSWITKNSNKALIFSGIALGAGILAKYQIVVAAIAMLVSVLLLSRKRLKISLAKLVIIIIIGILIVAPWFLINFQFNGQTKFQTVQYVLQVGGENRPAYSNRFFTPVFYLIEMTWPFNDIPVHPVSVPIMILGLCGLGLFAYRRRTQDVFLLIWFIAIYAFFAFIPDKQWRYVDVLFPILAIAAASFIVFLYKKIRSWKPKQLGFKADHLMKLFSAFFIILIASALIYSSYESYQMTARDQIQIPIQQTAEYLTGHLSQNQSAVIVCAFNLLNQDMFRFYLPANMSSEQVWQYPFNAVDAFTPNFNITEFLNLCVQRNVKYIILYDFGPHTLFFNSTLDYTQVETMIYNTHMFGDPSDQPFFGQFYGNYGYRLFLVRFLG